MALPFLGFLAGTGCGEKPPQFPVEPVAAKAPGPPAAPEHFVFRPTFETAENRFTAGTAFAVMIPGEERPILITAVHVLGDLASRKSGEPPKDLRRAIKKVTLVDCFDEDYTLDAGNDILPIDAAPAWESTEVGDGARAGDILAIRLPKGAKLATAKLASSTPPIGDRVWLAAQVLDGAPATERLHAAKTGDVPSSPTSDLNYDFEDPDIDHRATSGAPLLNGDGDVVAINLGLGFANPVVRFRYYLEKAAEESPGR